MNKAQKLLQPLIDAQEMLWSTSQNDPDYERGCISGTCTGLEIARDALAAITDDITLADVPAVEWSHLPADENYHDRYIHGDWIVYGSADANGVVNTYGRITTTKSGR